MLKGIKVYALEQGATKPTLDAAVDISAIVTVTDDGGSSGRLRRDFEMLPPGDIRNCMVALAEDESLLTRLFQHRFSSGVELKGHSFGNLFLAAMTQVTGDFASAVRLSSEVLAIAGHIYPSTEANVHLLGHLADGKIVKGETVISRSVVAIERIELRPAACKPLPDALRAIAQADLITFGPGSLYTSVIPNLLVKGVARAIQKSPALKACFVNLMWQPGETTGLTAADHVAAIERHVGGKIVDVAIVNSAPIAEQRLRRYAEQSARPVEIDMPRLMKMGVQVITHPLLAEGHKVRHDSDLIAQVAVELARRGRRRIQRARALAS